MDPQQQSKKRSAAWNHFDSVKATNRDVIIEFAQCKYCKAKYKYSENGKVMGTSNMNDHLNGKHPEVGSNSNENLQPDFVFSQEKYRAALLKWIVECNQPFTAPREASFLELVRSLNPTAKTVSSATLKRDLMRKFSEKRDEVTSMVKEIPGKLSFTMDGWTSKNIFPFVNIRAHWIDTCWKQRSVLLEFSEINGEHSGANLCKIFMKCLSSYDISVSKILGITLDNASNNDTFISSFNKQLNKFGINISSEDFHIRCIAHIMNLSVQDILSSLKCEVSEEKDEGNGENEENGDEEEYDNGGENDGNDESTYIDNDSDEEDNELNYSEILENSLDKNYSYQEDDLQEETEPVNSIIKKLRKPIKKIRKSPKLREALKLICKCMGVKYKVPIIDVKVRWNSSYYMLERYSELKEPLEKLYTQTKDLSSFLITSREWSELDIIRMLLQKFDRATKFISMERHTTISAYLPTMDWSINALQLFIGENSGSIVHSAEEGLAKLKKYKLLMKHAKIPLIAMFLNPSLKLSYLKEHSYSNASIKKIEKMIQGIFESRCEGKENVLVEKNEKENDDFYAHMYKRSKRVDNLNEFQKYMLYPLSSSKEDELNYWKTHETELPCLAKMARDYLGAQSSSIPVERDFSGGVDLVTPTRCSLKPETIRACMCLKSWFKNEI